MRAFQTRWRSLWVASPPLTAVGLLMLAALAGAAIGLVLDPRLVTGAPAWLKPAKFASSTAIYAFTLAWMFTHLDGWTRVKRWVGWITAIVFVVEVAIIDVQAARGVTSHFNVGTAVDGVLFTVMGSAILLVWVTSIVLTVAVFRHRFADRALGWAFRLGLLITVLGAATGGLMTQADAGAARGRTHRADDRCRRPHRRGARWRARPAGDGMEPGTRRPSRPAFPGASRDAVRPVDGPAARRRPVRTAGGSGWSSSAARATERCSGSSCRRRCAGSP